MGDADVDGLDTDAVHAVLAHRDRRVLLRLLAELDTPERLSSLARNLATYTDRSGRQSVQYAYWRLYHAHVPAMAAAGIVAYDDRAGTVELTHAGQSLVDALD